jgi:hypothetical protein
VEGNAGAQTATFTVSLSAVSNNPVTVQYATADGTAAADSDYSTTSGTLTFAPGETQKTIAVPVNGDTVLEADETFLVNLSNPTNAVVGIGQGTGTIRNDDIGADPLEINDAAASASNFGSTNSVNRAGLTLHTAVDQDYFRFAPMKKGTFKVTISATQGSGMFNLAVFNSAQTLLASNKTQTGSLTLTLSLAANKTYFVRAMSSTGSLFGYALSVARQGGARGLIGSSDGIEIGDETDVWRADWKSNPKLWFSAGAEFYSTIDENSASISTNATGSRSTDLHHSRSSWPTAMTPGEWNFWSPVVASRSTEAGISICWDDCGLRLGVSSGLYFG